MDVRDNQLYLGECAASAIAEAFGTPLYVYEEEVIRRQCRIIRESFAAIAPEFHYAMKANPNPALLRVIKAEGMGIDTVSPHEVRLALESGFLPEQILFTGSNTSAEELRFAVEKGVTVNVGSLNELDHYGQLNPGGRVALRINPDVGAGHHPHCITGGPNSKFGIYHTESAAIADRLQRHSLKLVGIHSHIGTGILHTEDMLEAMEIILRTARPFPGLEFIDFGGGFGIPYRPEERPLPMKELGRAMAERFAVFRAEYGSPVKMKLEPGRFLVAQSGTLLVRVTNQSRTPAHLFVGTDSGFNHLVRPTMYGAYHEIVNATVVKGERVQAVVAGNICESGDLFTQNGEGLEARELTLPETGHLLAILDAGAYGMSQSSQYNMRARPAEVMVFQGIARLIRRRESYEDLVRDYVTGGGRSFHAL
ncbi:MAG: diaminopimelate decarboxylase [Deltaproteobacteria bacterium]|nr:diaminopimelate decarboxylase [Deltaproteobacteria bacterium]